LVGAGTSLLAVALFSPGYVIYMRATDLHIEAPILLSYLALIFFTGLFSFLAVGWMLLLVSIIIALGLYRIAAAA